MIDVGDAGDAALGGELEPGDAGGRPARVDQQRIEPGEGGGFTV